MVVLAPQDIESMKARLEEMEREAAKLKEIQVGTSVAAGQNMGARPQSCQHAADEPRMMIT